MTTEEIAKEMEELVSDLKAIKAQDIYNQPNYKTTLAIYRALITAGMPKATVNKIIGKIKIDVATEVINDSNFDNVIKEWASVLLLNYVIIMQDFGDSEVFVSFVNNNNTHLILGK